MPDSVRVLMVTRLLPPEHSGAGRQALLQARALADTGEATVTIIAGDASLWLPRREQAGGLTIVRLPVRRRGSRLERLAFGLGVLGETLTRPYDVVHLHGNAAVLPFLRAAKRVRKLRVAYKPTMAGKDDACAVARRSQARVRCVDLWLCTSSALLDACRTARVPKARAVRIPNAVNKEPFSAAVRPPAGRTRWVSVAAIQPRKRPHLIVRAWALLPEPRPLLSLAGPKLDREYARSMGDEIVGLGLENDVEVLGEREDVAEILGASVGFVLASAQEGLPNAALEALAAGLPLVLTKFEGVDDLAALAPGRVTVVASEPRELADAVLAADTVRLVPSALRQLAPESTARALLAAYRAAADIPLVETARARTGS